jgi:hypothetical protein
MAELLDHHRLRRCSQSPLRADSLEQFFLLTPGFCFVGPETRKPVSPDLTGVFGTK